MWTRSWIAYSVKLAGASSLAAPLLVASVAVVFPTAKAQETLNEPEAVEGQIEEPSFNPGDDFTASDIDPVTLAILSDALLRLQFLAIAALDTDEDVGLAQSGVVRAYLTRRQALEAVDIAGRIADPLWRARSYLWIADYVAVVEEDREKSRDWVFQAIEILTEMPSQRDGGEALSIAAIQLAELAFLEDATRTSRLIPDTFLQISKLQEIADIGLSQGRNPANLALAAQILSEAAGVAATLPEGGEERIALLIEIGGLQLAAEDATGAQATFTLVQNEIINGPEEGRFAAMTHLAAKLVEAGNQRGGMDVVRLIPEGAFRARALGAVAGALGQRNIDAAVPLFRLAMEESERIVDQQERFDVFAFLVERLTAVGRLADAFDLAFQITEEVPRAEALLNMGQTLIAQGKLQEAFVLKEYIPFVGMRAQVMGPVALGRGLEEDPVGASAILAEALDPTGFPFIPRYIPDALDAVLTAQIRGGTQSADQAIFARARDLAEEMPGDLQQVHALVQVAIAEARRGRIDDAQKTISAAYRTTFEHRDREGFDEALMAISLAQLAAGDLLGAYDTAARIPEPPTGGPYPRTPDGGFDVPRYQALIRVAAAAGRLGDPGFGQEVTEKIGFGAAKAIGLAAVAIAMSNQTTDLIEVINDIRDGALLSPDFSFLLREALNEAAETNADTAPSVDAVPDLGEAPQLAPLPE